jgi:thioredoxin 1
MNTKHADLDTIQTVTDATFNDLVLEGSGPIAVEFMSYGCGFCRAIEPVLKQVAEKLHSKLKIFRVNVPAQSELAGTYGIEGTPTFIMFSNGNEMARSEGPEPTVASITAMLTQPFDF